MLSSELHSFHLGAVQGLAGLGVSSVNIKQIIFFSSCLMQSSSVTQKKKKKTKLIITCMSRDLNPLGLPLHVSICYIGLSGYPQAQLGFVILSILIQLFGPIGQKAKKGRLQQCLKASSTSAWLVDAHTHTLVHTHSRRKLRSLPIIYLEFQIASDFMVVNKLGSFLLTLHNLTTSCF